ncbi:hypothetical protein [Mesobacillus stamsii]|uniref:Uncharacterized protein n=1 Tax=Mesobacillus stamsii TaxID=225347 RepID=A0ABU0G0L6_9BACI|nr:hypothetical protein [Mesobacillus stamsii]MDQ0415694.1 hypothetical protein [Mesobacillus stamsii]
MIVKEINYEVTWGQKARVKLAEMKPYKIDPKLVFRNSKSILSVKPREKADEGHRDRYLVPSFFYNWYVVVVAFKGHKEGCLSLPEICRDL